MVSVAQAHFFTEPHYSGYPAILVRLLLIDPEELKELLIGVWRCQAPRVLIAAWEARQAQESGGRC